MPSKISNGLQLIKMTLGLLAKKPKILVLPIISASAYLLLITVIVVPLLQSEQSQWHQTLFLSAKNLEFIGAILLALFFCNVLVLSANAALIVMMHQYIENKILRFSFALKRTIQILPRLMQWAIFNSTAGIFFRLAPQTTKKMTTLESAAMWPVICYLAVPIIAMERLGLQATVQRATQLLEEHWGRNLIRKTGLGPVFFLLRLLALIPLVIGFKYGQLHYKIIGSAISATLIFILAILNIATHNIFRTLLYVYAANQTITKYAPLPLIKSAFSQRSSAKHTKKRS